MQQGNARQRMMNAMSGSGAAQAMHGPDVGPRAPTQRPPAVSGPNFAQQNRQRIKSMQTIVKARELEKEDRATAEKFKMTRFQDVQGRLHSDPRMHPPAEGSGPSRAAAAAAMPARKPMSTGTGARPGAAAAAAAASGAPREQRASVKAPMPTRVELDEQRSRVAAAHAHADGVNFIARNTVDAITGSQFNSQNYHSGFVKTRADQPAANKPVDVHENFGRVPAYLQQRQAEAAAAEAQRREDAVRAREASRGMVLMPESERLATLAALQERLRAAEQALSAFPLVVETESRKRKKMEAEAQVRQLEGMVQALSHEKVYVKP